MAGSPPDGGRARRPGGGSHRGGNAITNAVRTRDPNGEPLDDQHALAAVVIALTRVGATDSAAALAAMLNQGCYECARARGWLALANGRRGQARSWFAKAVQLGPRLPAARVDLGRLDALEGKPAAALAQYREAARLAPRWADPLRYQGDLLGRQGDLAGARTAYAKAAAFAPRWGSLRLNQGRVLAALGDRAGAAAAFAAADMGSLAAADRVRLAQAREARQ